MGVSAVFVSCVAVRWLPEPQNPPTSQKDILAMALAPVIGFSVFASILVRKSVKCIIYRKSTFLFFFLSPNYRWFIYFPLSGWDTDSLSCSEFGYSAQ